MIVASDKQTDQFIWGEWEQFHSIEQDDKKFRLFDVVKIELKGGALVKGEIGYIYKNAVDILPDREVAAKIKFADIEKISY